MLDRLTVRPLCYWMLDIAFLRAVRSYILIGKVCAKICKLLIVNTMLFLAIRAYVKKLYN